MIWNRYLCKAEPKPGDKLFPVGKKKHINSAKKKQINWRKKMRKGMQRNKIIKKIDFINSV